MKISLIAFTAQGRCLAERLAALLGGEVNEALPLNEWTAQAFRASDALVFIGAAGIAVRAIAPYVNHKSADPAVVVVDEGGGFAVPILSGHLGGANDLARRISALIGAVPVITTATDVRGIFAVDEWARRQSLHVENPERIKLVSAKLLAGERVNIISDYPVTGNVPEGVCVSGTPDAAISVRVREDALSLVPKTAVLGIGCRRGTSAETIESEYRKLLEEEHISAFSLEKVSSIDLKKDEGGIISFCERHKLPFETFTAESLGAVSGEFSASEFVASTVGVDNVCERSAVLSSGGRLIVKKRAGNGVTLAVAERAPKLNWNWRD